MIEARSIDGKVRQVVTLVKLLRVDAHRSTLLDSAEFISSALKELGVESFEVKSPDGTVLLSLGEFYGGQRLCCLPC